MRSDSEIKFLLGLIIFILLFGAGTVLNALNIVFWIAVFLVIIILVLVGIGYLFQEAEKGQIQRKVQKQDDEAEQIQYELDNPGRTRKKWFGIYVESEKKQGKFTESSLFYLMIIIGGLVGLFFLAIIVFMIINMFSSDTSIPVNSSSNQNIYNSTYSYQELKKMDK